MTDTEKLRTYIDLHGYKLGYVARVMGITPGALRCKLTRETEFKVSEAADLARLLGLNREQRDECFFAQELSPQYTPCEGGRR